MQRCGSQAAPVDGQFSDGTEFFDKKGSIGVYFGRRCLQCLTAFRFEHVKINGSAAMLANVPHGGSSAVSVSLSANTVRGQCCVERKDGQSR
jgi:hypothetical protein